MTGYFVFSTFFHIFLLVTGEPNLPVLKEIVSLEFLPRSNIISCNENESINLIKILSTEFRRYLVVYSADKALVPFEHEPQCFVLDLQCPRATTLLRQNIVISRRTVTDGEKKNSKSNYLVQVLQTFSAKEINLQGINSVEPIYHFFWLETTRMNGEYADDLNLFQRPSQWILLGVGITSNSAYKTDNVSESGENWYWSFLETLNILTDSNVRVIEKASDEKITITGVYKLGNTFLKEPLAEWSSKGSFAFLNSKSLARRRWDLQGIHIPSATVITHPDTLNHLEDLVDIEKDTTTKLTYNMVALLGDILRARLTFKIEKLYGVFINGSWTGMVGDMERKEIEIAGAPLFLNVKRYGFIEYFSAIITSRAKFLYLAPPLSYSSNIFALPFDTTVWICCLSMVSISCAFLYAALNYEKVLTSSNRVAFTEIVVFNIGAICQQGTVAESKNPSGRIFTLFLYLSYMFLYISYSACIVAILQSSDTSVQKLVDFLKSPMKAGAEDMIYVREYFKNVDGEVHKAIYNKKIAPKGEVPHFLSVKDGIKEVRKGFYGFHVELNLGYREIQKTFTEEEKCGLQEVKESFFQSPEPMLSMKKWTPFAEQFKIGMSMCIERGFKSRFTRRYYTKKPICVSKAARFVSVGINDCYWAFMLLSVGLITAFMIMLFEIVYSRYIKTREKHRNLSGHDILPGIEFFD